MGQMIKKPDTNPILVAALNWIGFGGLGYFLMGQKSKAITAWIVTIVGGAITCGFGYLFCWVTAYDAYLLGQKLQNGEEIGETENALDFLKALPGFHD